jgi:hypothetical protein
MAWITSQCQSASTIQKIEFTTLSRGYQKQIFISPDSVITVIDGRVESNKVVKRKLGSEEWESLIVPLKNISLHEVAGLKSPSNRRAFDGARHSTITIESSDGNSWNHSFDDESPHEKLKPLMDAIKKIEGEKAESR